MASFSNLMTSEEILKYFSDTVFENQELHQYHNPYDQEIREYQALENGDWEQLKKSLAEQHEGKLGRLAKNDLRHLKNMGIVVVTLSCRAAIRGGILPEVAFTLSDAYIRKLEDLTDEKDIEAAFEQAAANKNRPTLIEFMVSCELDVYPMVPGGKALTDMLFG